MNEPLTHAALFALYPTPGFVAPDCPGVTDVLWVRDDPAGPDGPRRVELRLCRACLTRVSIDLDAGKVLNAYREPADLVAGLAERLTSHGKGLVR